MRAQRLGGPGWFVGCRGCVGSGRWWCCCCSCRGVLGGLAVGLVEVVLAVCGRATIVSSGESSWCGEILDAAHFLHRGRSSWCNSFLEATHLLQRSESEVRRSRTEQRRQSSSRLRRRQTKRIFKLLGSKIQDINGSRRSDVETSYTFDHGLRCRLL